VSLLAGIPVCFYFSNDSRFQWMGALLAGGPVCTMPFDLFARCLPFDQHRLLHLILDLYGNIGFLYQRFFLYLPLITSTYYKKWKGKLSASTVDQTSKTQADATEATPGEGVRLTTECARSTNEESTMPPLPTLLTSSSIPDGALKKRRSDDAKEVS